MIDINYWKKLLVNIGKIKDEWSSGKNYSKKLKKFLLSIDETQRNRLVRFIHPKITCPSDELIEHYDEILTQEKAIILQALREFYDGKQYIIEDYIANHNDSYTDDEKKSPFFSLIKTYEINPDKLIEILLMKLWSSKRFDGIFICDPQLTNENIELVESDIKNIISSIRNKSKGKYSYKSCYKSRNNNIFWIEKQASDKMERDIKDNVRIRPPSDLLFNLDVTNNLFEIKSGNKSVFDAVTNTLKRKLSIKNLIYYESGEETQIDYDRFKSGFITPSHELKTNVMEICGVAFRNMSISNSAPMILPKRSGHDLRKTLNELSEKEIIDLKDVNSINYIKVIYNDCERTIKFNINKKTGTLVLDLNGGVMNKDKINEVSEVFKNQFGIPIGVEITETDENLIKENNYNLIFSSSDLDKISDVTKKYLSELKDEGFINYTANKVYWCRICKKTIPNYEKCPVCGSKTKFSLSKVKIKRKPRETLQRIKTKLSNSGFNVNNTLIERTGSVDKKYNFIQLFIEKQMVYLYFYDGGRIKDILDYFNRSHLPIIIINNSKRKIKEFAGGIFPQIAISKVLLMNDSEFKQYFDNILDEVVRKLEDLVINSANNSAIKLNSFLKGEEPEYDPTALEDDVYNLMRYIFKTGEKWGKEKSGKPVPEGIVGYGFLKKHGTTWNRFTRSLIWDCKLTNKDKYGLVRSEKIKAERYIICSCQSNAIKSHSKELSAYISFTNKIGYKQYENFAKKAKKIENWNGNVILFELNALITLYNLMKQKFIQLDGRRSQFYYELSRLFRKTEKAKHYTHITEDKINELISKVMEKDTDTPELDYEKTFLHLESDVIKK